MFAYVGIVKHFYFAVTDADGNYRLPATLPAGRYTIEAYHRKAGRASELVDVGEHEQRRIDFSLEAESGKGVRDD
jgi:hypothetical protein